MSKPKDAKDQKKTPNPVKEVREALGESTTKFAARMGVDQSTISRWERNGIPKRVTSQKYVDDMLSGIQRDEKLTKRRERCR